MSELRAPLVVVEPLTEGEADVRQPIIINEPLTEGTPNLRVPLVINEPLTEGNPNLRQSLLLSEALTEGYRNLRQSLMMIECLQPVGPEEYMSTEAFPGFGNSILDPAVPAALDPFNSKLPGLAYSVHKKPGLRTRISDSASGVEIRSALMQYPRWDFELTYEFLEDRSGAESSLKTILGFFLQMLGSYDTWLFKDPDDYLCDNNLCGYSDGVTTEFPFSRVLGGYRERVGQVDTANTVTVYLQADEAGVIPATPGPYTLAVAHAASYVEDGGVTKLGVPMVKVTGTPLTGQYAVNILTGVYTFAAADQGVAVVINYRYVVAPADYTVTMPNRLIFDSAPVEGVVSWSGQFFFVCRFTEDQQDYEKFMDKLWSLQTCEFRSVIA